MALLCAGTPLDKTKCESVQSLYTMSNSFAQPVPPTPDLLMISGGKDHITKEHCAVFLDILTQIFSGFQEVFPVTDSEQLWSLGVAHREVRSCSSTREPAGNGSVCLCCLQASESSVNLSRFAHLLAVSRPFQWLPTWQKLAISEDSEQACMQSLRDLLHSTCCQLHTLCVCATDKVLG